MPDYAQSYTHRDYDFDAHLREENPQNFAPADPAAVGREEVRDESTMVQVLAADLPAGTYNSVGGSTVIVREDGTVSNGGTSAANDGSLVANVLTNAEPNNHANVTGRHAED